MPANNKEVVLKSGITPHQETGEVIGNPVKNDVMEDEGVRRMLTPCKRVESERVTLAQISEEEADQSMGVSQIKGNEPVIYGEEEYIRKVKEFNHGVDKIPHGVIRFDTTELEELHKRDSAFEWSLVVFTTRPRQGVGIYA